MERSNQHLLYNLSEDEYSLKGIGLLVILFFGSLLFAALASPLAFQLVHYLDPDQSGYLANKSYSRFFDRARLFCVVVLFPLLFIKTGLTTAEKIGFRGDPRRIAIYWACYGMGMMAIVYIPLFLIGVLEPLPQFTWTRLINRALIAIVGATIIGLIEETLFRGLVFRIFYTAFKPPLAILFSSVFFAYLHFKMSGETIAHIPIQEIGFDDGFMAIWYTLTAILEGFNGLLFLNLTLVGIILHQVFLFTRSLWACIGLHAGWVSVIMTLSRNFNETDRANLFTGTEKIADGIWVTVIMTIFVFVFSRKIALKPKE